MVVAVCVYCSHGVACECKVFVIRLRCVL